MACFSLLQSVCQPGGTGGAGGGGHEALRNNITLQTVTALSPLEPKTYRLIPREDDYRKTRSLHVSYFAKTTAQNNQENRQINRDFAIDLNPLTNASIDLRDNRQSTHRPGVSRSGGLPSPFLHLHLGKGAEASRHRSTKAKEHAVDVPVEKVDSVTTRSHSYCLAMRVCRPSDCHGADPITYIHNLALANKWKNW